MRREDEDARLARAVRMAAKTPNPEENLGLAWLMSEKYASTRQLLKAAGAEHDDPLLMPVNPFYDQQKYVERAQMRSDVLKAVKSLDDRQCRIMTAIYDLDGDGYRTKKECAKEIGVSENTGRMIEFSALRSLRHPSRSRRLRWYADFDLM